MGTYSNRSHMIPEASSTGSASHFAWFYPGSFFSKATSIPSQETQINLKQALDVAPVCSVPPSADSAKGNNPGTKTPRVKKQKASTASTNETPSKASSPKQPKKSSPKKTKLQTMPEAKREKKNLDVDIERASFDFSRVPSPFCSCTGIPRVCYKWGAGGWQSSCCTTNISEYPLPMSSTRPGARMAGRKMSNGAYVKLLVKLAAEGHDLFNPVDLKSHWARHGTNKFVTIK